MELSVFNLLHSFYVHNQMPHQSNLELSIFRYACIIPIIIKGNAPININRNQFVIAEYVVSRLSGVNLYV